MSGRKHRILAAGTAASLLADVLSLSVHGADEDLLFQDIPTVYAAVRHDQPISQAPASVSIITRDDIRKYGYRSLAQAVASVAGIFTTDDHGYTYIGVRGLGLPTDYNSRVLFLLNGMPLNDKYWSSFYTDLMPDLLEAVERIEVVKGPSSALYGSNAIFAIINVVTRKGGDVDGVVVTAEAGSQPSGRGVLTYGKSFRNGLDLFFSGHYEQNEGERHLSFGKFGKAHDADDERLSDAYLSAKYKEFSLQLWYSDRLKEIPTGQFHTVVGNDKTTTADRWYLAELRWEREFSESLKLMLRSYYQRYNYRGTYFYGDPDYKMTTEGTHVGWAGFESQLNWRPIERNLVTVGAVGEYHWTDLRGDARDGNGDIISAYPGAARDFPFYAVYLQDEFQVLPTLRLTGGVRFDSYPYASESRVTPRAALVWNATQQTTVKLLYGAAFRAPSVSEIYYSNDAGYGAVNKSIHSEEITTYEMVVEQDFRHGLQGKVAVFHNEADGLIAQPDPADYVLMNVFDVDTTGVEVELAKSFTNGVRTFANATFQDSSARGGQLINSPRWLANFGIVYPIFGDKLAVSVRESFVSSRPTRVKNQDTGESYLTDLVFTSENALPNWSFSLSFQNLFDQRNLVPTSADGTLDVIPQHGRTIYLRASYKF